MGAFRYIPEGNTSPRGKHKVYLCAHKDEIAQYITPVSNLILSIYPNCAVWYYDENESDTVEVNSELYYDRLSQMRLFVIPVTKKFLEQDNEALKDVKYAKEHNIPLLFLLQDDELVDRFNKVFGKLHCIKKSDAEYAEKIERFLSLLFVDEKQQKKIEKAFDAKVFLSYRKVDIKHAKQLIDMIHKSFKNVAIWFDDYLTSGEKFDVEIRSALKDSDFMALVLTPNVLKVPNYVVKTECLEAKKNNKIIIPFELVSTDKKQLVDVLKAVDDMIEDCFEAYIDISDEQMFIKTLQKKFSAYQRVSKMTQEQKEYLIGLAYLMGINVERNAEVGFELISRSAEAGNSEAMNKLYQMYRMGDYVQADYKEAILWKLKSVRALCNLRYNSRYRYQKEKYGIEYIYSWLELLDYQRYLVEYEFDNIDADFVLSNAGNELNDGSSADLYSKNMAMEGQLSLFTAFLYPPRKAPSDKYLLAAAKVEFTLGERYIWQSDDSLIKDAKECFANAQSLLNKIRNKTLESQMLVADVYIEQAKVQVTRDITSIAVKKAPSPIERFILAESVKQINKMKNYANKAVGILEKLKKENPENITIISKLSDAYATKSISCENDWLVNKNVKQKHEYIKYWFMHMELTEEIANQKESFKNLKDVRDVYGFTLFTSSHKELIDMFDKAMRKKLYDKLCVVEGKLEEKFGMERKFTGFLHEQILAIIEL